MWIKTGTGDTHRRFWREHFDANVVTNEKINKAFKNDSLRGQWRHALISFLLTV